jgi:hypothetical protein
MHIKLITYRNKNDFVWGSFRVTTGAGWMNIEGRLKKTGKQTLYCRMEYMSGHGKEIIDMQNTDEE